MPGGGYLRRGDQHEMASLLEHDLLNRLIDAAIAASPLRTSPVPPDQYIIETWKGFLSESRRQTEHELGHSPGNLFEFWPEAQDENTKDTLFDVDSDSPEFAAVKAVFLAESPQPRHYGRNDIPGRWSAQQVTRVQRVQNGCHQEGVQARHDIFRNSLNAQGVKFKADVHVRWLFHGPGSAQALDSIVSTIDGFNPLLSGSQVGELWGAGSYFARDAQYVAVPPYVATLDSGLKQVLLCLVEIGMPCLATPEHVGTGALLPFRHEKHRYNSTVDSLSNPEIFVVQSGTQALPAYLITFC